MSIKLFLVAEKYNRKLKKEAGLVKVPNELTNNLYSFSINFFERCCYEMYQKFILNNKKLPENRKLELRLLFEKFKKNADAKQGDNFEIPNEWQNEILYDEKSEKEITLRDFKLSHGFSVVAFGFGKRPEININGQGEFNPWFIIRDNIMFFGHINVNISYYLKKIYYLLINSFSSEEIDMFINISYKEIKSTIEHELMHLLQHINKIIDIEFGYISKKNQTPKFNQNNIKDNESYVNNKNHFLDDAEFYPILNDDIVNFKNNINKFPFILHEDILKYSLYNKSKKEIQLKYFQIVISETNERGKIVNKKIKNAVLSRLDRMLQPFEEIRNNFKILQQDAPGKYEKAAKEFYKTMTES